MTLSTDLNHRERQRFAEELLKVADSAREAATALLAEEDSKAMIHYIIMSLAGGSVAKELQAIFQAAVDVAKATEELEKGETP